MDKHSDRLLILDFGSQYTQLIARRIRSLGVYCEIYPYDIALERIKSFGPKAFVLSGSPRSVHDEMAGQVDPAVFEMGLPILGICYGMQTMAKQLSGDVKRGEAAEYGHAMMNLCASSGLLPNYDLGSSLDVWMSHGDQVSQLPKGFICTAKTSNAEVVMMEDPSRRFYGVQFHPEVTHTDCGTALLRHYLFDVCQLEATWSAGHIIDEQIALVQNQVGDQQVILGLSGGVDSSVVAFLLHRAIGDQLTCIFVDNGLLRLNEAEEVMDTFSVNEHIKVILVDAKDEFLAALKGVDDPEQKRKIIGRIFIEVFDREATKLKAQFLAQGTIYPDVIESAKSATGKADVIKSHHNVGGLPDDMALELVEPIRDLFKDEVREVGRTLGIPDERIDRHPFPGPGLGVRVLGEVKPEYLERLRLADAIFIEALREHGWYQQVDQAFAVYLPVKSVGVVGDQRQYADVIALRAVQTIDFMTATWAPLPYELLAEVSSKIVNEVSGISRVVYDVCGKPPATIEWE